MLVSLVCLAAAPALAGPAEDAMAHSKAFERAVDARDAKAVLALYAADAHVIWPGQGEEATGRAQIEKLLADLLTQLPKDARITLQSQTAIPLGTGYVATVGHWTQSFTGPDGKPQRAELRTSEIIKRDKGKTLYVLDHASIGAPPPPDAPGQPSEKK
jgi:uncharacterized protein (TIGR02246 family)